MSNGYINTKDKFLPAVTTHGIDINHPFIWLSDTPTTYSGSANYLVTVNPTASGLEFTSPQDVHEYFGTFGSYYHYAEDNTESSTTSTSYIEKLSLTVSGIPAGNYRIGWHCEWQYETSNFQVNIRVQVDDDMVLTETEYRTVSSSDWDPATGFVVITISGGDHYIDLDWKGTKEMPATTSYIRKSRLEFWRVE